MNVRACSECGAENPALAKFCMSCGAPLALTCPDCGVPRQPGAAFCVECGARFGATADARPETGSAPGPEAPELSEERRNASVLFADLSGYTALAERLDPEVTKSLVDHALGRLSREVVEHGGRVDKYIGDNVMAVFGAPVAHEDDPERAVRAGLAMQAAMSEINAEIGTRAASSDVEMELRVGVNSGAVIAGRSGDQYTVIGDTVNVAARLQAAGRPGEVTVGPATRRLTATAIEYRELEPLTLKGKSQPMPAWEAVEVVDEASRPRSGRPVAPLIGRDEELALLLSLFDRALRESRPHLVTVFGQAGVGKSRLLSELATALRRRGERVDTLIGRSPAYGTATTYSALGEIISERFALSAGDAPDAVVDKLTAGIAGLTHGDQEADAARTAAQVARVLGIDSRGDGDEEVDEQVRDRIFAAVRFLLQLIAENAPVVIAIEDIHWADEGMLDLIEHVAGSGQGPILIVCLARDELLDRRPSWGSGRRNATTISLDALSTDETEELVEMLLAGRAGDPDLAEQVAGRSGGNPLFAEEMVNRLREEQSEDAGELPDSVHAVLAARLDALDPDERHLLQAASVIGQSFWEGTVSELVGEAEIDAPLATLVDKDLLSPSTTGRLAGEQEFSFKHALVRDVAYATLPRGLRARQHVEIARIVEGRAGENREGVAAILAEHHGRAADLAEQAGLPEEEQRSMRVQAAYAFELAGDVAASLYSNAEAHKQYDSALRLPSGLEPPDRARVQERRGDTAFRAGHVDAAIESWTEALEFRSNEADPARAGELHRKIGTGLWHKGDRESSIAQFQHGIDLLKDGDPCRELIELYAEAASLYVETGDNMLAIYAAEKAQRLAETLGQSSTASRAHLTFGRVFGRIGDLDQARASLERSVQLAREAGPGEALPALLALGRHLDVAEVDYPAAGRVCEEALEIADELGDVPAQIELRAALGQLAVHPADWEEVSRHASASARLAEREGLSGQLCLPLLLQGIGAWHQGDWEVAEACLERSHGIAAAGGRSEAAFSALLWLGTCKRDRGDYPMAVDDLTRAADVCDRAGLIAQSAEATGARAAVLAISGRGEEARSASAALDEMTQIAAHPVGRAAAAEARGASTDDPDAATAALREAIESWEAAGRPLNAVRAGVLLSWRLRDGEPARAAEVLETAAATADRLDVPHLAVAARAAIGS
jgi:class 3 adenylate cyclase/tetratricopeptide (TPR) repeat protein